MSKKTEPKSFKILRFLNFVQVASPKQIYQAIYEPLFIDKEVLKADLENLLKRKELAFYLLSVPSQQVLFCTPEGAQRGGMSWKKPPIDPRSLKRRLACLRAEAEVKILPTIEEIEQFKVKECRS